VTILRKYGLSWDVLLAAPYRPDPKPAQRPPTVLPRPDQQPAKPLPAGEKPEAYTKWVSHCRERLDLRFAQWIVEKKEDYPASAPWRAIFPQDLPSALDTIQAGKLPAALAAGDVGRAALRMWAPQLSHLPRGGGASTCKWCQQPAGETCLHILQCPAQPPLSQRLIAKAAALIRRDMEHAAQPVDPRQQFDILRLYRATWPGQDLGTLRRCLLCVSRIIDEYSKMTQRHAEAVPDSYDLVRPVHAIPA
jgi:hypothetical protein